MSKTAETPAPIKRHLDLWIGILLGVGIAAALSAGHKISTLGISIETFAEIEGRAFFALTAGVLVITHIFRQEFLKWNRTFIAAELIVSLGLFALAVWANEQGFWETKALAHLSIVAPFIFLLFSLLVYAEAIFTQRMRDEKLIPLRTIVLQMASIFLLLYVGRIIFPPNHVFLTIYLALALFDMTSRAPMLDKKERWEPLLGTKKPESCNY